MPKDKRMHETDKDKKSVSFLQGRHQSISPDPAAEFKKTTLAAGAVLWRGDPTDPEVAVIHRPHYDDWSLAKGKVDAGESLPVTAAREIAEETGMEVRLGSLLGKVTYPVQGRTKVVYYWLAEVTGGKFKKNGEVDQMKWVSLKKARKMVSYDLDEQVLDKAKDALRTPVTARVLYVRHARAHKRETWSGDDNLRPLDKKGRRQAEMLVPLLSAYQPTAIYSAEPDRCRQTAAPLADELSMPLTVDAALGDAAWEDKPKSARKAFDKVVAGGGVPVVVAQGGVIPGILDAIDPGFLAQEVDELKVKKSSVWVLSFAGDELVGADYLASPLPVK